MVRSIVQRLSEMHRVESMDLLEYLNESKRDYSAENKKFEVGDIVFSRYYSNRSRQIVSPHPIMIITKIDDRGDYTQYEGIPLKTDRGKSKIYPNTIPISDYSTILVPNDPGASYPSGKKSFIDVQDLARFRSYDMNKYRYAYAGHASDEFFKFAMEGLENYRAGRDNSHMKWDR